MVSTGFQTIPGRPPYFFFTKLVGKEKEQCLRIIQIIREKGGYRMLLHYKALIMMIIINQLNVECELNRLVSQLYTLRRTNNHKGNSDVAETNAPQVPC